MSATTTTTTTTSRPRQCLAGMTCSMLVYALVASFSVHLVALCLGKGARLRTEAAHFARLYLLATVVGSCAFAARSAMPFALVAPDILAVILYCNVISRVETEFEIRFFCGLLTGLIGLELYLLGSLPNKTLSNATRRIPDAVISTFILLLAWEILTKAFASSTFADDAGAESNVRAINALSAFGLGIVFYAVNRVLKYRFSSLTNACIVIIAVALPACLFSSIIFVLDTKRSTGDVSSTTTTTTHDDGGNPDFAATILSIRRHLNKLATSLALGLVVIPLDVVMKLKGIQHSALASGASPDSEVGREETLEGEVRLAGAVNVILGILGLPMVYSHVKLAKIVIAVAPSWVSTTSSMTTVTTTPLPLTTAPSPLTIINVPPPSSPNRVSPLAMCAVLGVLYLATLPDSALRPLLAYLVPNYLCNGILFFVCFDLFHDALLASAYVPRTKLAIAGAVFLFALFRHGSFIWVPFIPEQILYVFSGNE